VAVAEMPFRDATFDVVDCLEDGRQVLCFTAGPMAGRRVLAFPDDQCLPNSWVRPLTPYERAEQLLLSLLTPDQGMSWLGSKGFWVATSYGDLEFGELSNMRFKSQKGEELRLCVVPENHGRGLPPPDVWVNLLLALKSDPGGFFAMANWSRRKGEWFLGPIPGFEYQRRLL
jgi:hypothetical protein